MYNKVTLIGNLGADPEMKTFDSGNTVSQFTMATSESYKDKDGEKQEKTEWHSIVAWGKLAEICEKYLTKGSKVLIEGKLTTRSWEKEDGTKGYKTEVVAREMKMLGSNPQASSDNNNPAPTEEDDDLPF